MVAPREGLSRKGAEIRNLRVHMGVSVGLAKCGPWSMRLCSQLCCCDTFLQLLLCKQNALFPTWSFLANQNTDPHVAGC